MSADGPNDGPRAPVNRTSTSAGHLRGSSLLLSGRFAALAIGLVTEVILVRFLPKDEYGAFMWALSIVSIGASLSVFGLDKAAARFVAIYQERSPAKVGPVIALMGATIITIGLLIVALVLGLRDAVGSTGVVGASALGILSLVIVLAPLRALDAWLVALLAIFASPMAILVRRYLLAPGLEFFVAAGAAIAGAPVAAVAVGYVVAAVIGVAVAAGMLFGAASRRRSVPTAFDARLMPVRELFGYALPLLSSDFVYVLRGAMIVVFIEALRTVSEVAEFRAVLPIARTNLIVLQTFSLLFAPAAARFFAKGSKADLNDLYWRSAGWIAVATLPVLLASFSLAGPVTEFLFGEAYREAGPVLAVLAVGYYVNAALGFNALTLRTVGVVRYIFLADLGTILVGVPVSLVLIEAYGALGGAIGLSITLVLQNVAYHMRLHRSAGVQLLPARQARIYVAIVASALAMLALQALLGPPLLVSLALAVVTSVTVLYAARSILNVPEVFPELMRIPGLGRLLRP